MGPNDKSPTSGVAPDETRLFGQVAFERGLASGEQIKEALKIQAERAAENKHQNLGEILIEKGVLTPDQVRDLLRADDKVIMVCMPCAQNFNVLRQWKDQARCPQCGEELVEAKREQGVGVIATVGERAAPGSPIGKEFGGCRILELIGRGAMGEVYRARQVGLDRMVAVKMIPMSAQRPEFIKQLTNEARSIARLEHPNIVQVFGAGLEHGFFFLIMQLLNGETLAKRIAELGPIPADEAIRLVANVARGLQAAHTKGIIHRDIKPANIILTQDGRARLADFGLARDVQRSDGNEGNIMGTPYYMPPEQWQGKAGDPRSDLYALGVVMFEMLTGLKPFVGEKIEELRRHHFKSAPPSATTVHPDVPTELSAIVLKLMAKVPEQRYENVSALIWDLDRWKRGERPKAMVDTAPTQKCSFCDEANPMELKRCRVCHEPLQQVSQISLDVRSDEFLCPACKAASRVGSRSCEHCGAGFCRKCRKRVSVRDGFCEKCAPPPAAR